MAKALAPEVSTWPEDDPQLIGSGCGGCQAVTWPRQQRCPRCGGPDMTDRLLPRRGTLIAWTTQGFVPKLPYAGQETAESFEPFGVGLVQLENEVRVETRLTEADPDKLRTGMAVELTFVPLYAEADGTEVMTVAFAPV
ncbi:Zn-ribbon domain-containing OB-fold protein [Nocardia goodfellowii]|uniref:OB-fold protein n=1 Tax=Nocardia goodfellowii TaxID=882446 RepID=A0ABS4QLG4_9NOCA|nr:OB-fold domain-containing protein [Nocardia goodfellowii]MBP2191933.1 putative OB-fold protein [Nocardia goodfellowii]